MYINMVFDALLLQPLELFAFACILYYFSLKLVNGRNSKLPPGPAWHWPFIGDTIKFLKPHVASTNGKFLQKNIKKYGKIFRSHVFGYPTIISCDAQFNNFILQNEGRLFEVSYPKNIPSVLGDLTLLALIGDLHKKRRGIALTFFNSIKNHKNLVPEIEAKVLNHLTYWKNNQSLVICKEARKLTFNVMVHKILSLNQNDEESNQILENYSVFMKGLVSFPLNIPGTPYAKAIKARLSIWEIIMKIKDQRLNDKFNIKERNDDFLDILLSNDELSDDEVCSLIVDALFGGFETTATLIPIILKFLSYNQEVLDGLRAEHKSIRARVGNKPLSWSDYDNMKFTRMVINEALRIGNVVKFLHRKVIKPIKYKGYEIPAEWKVLPVLSAAHLDSDNFQEPEKFNPKRWEANIDSMNFMPFGGGKRLCPGYEIGRLETSIFLHHLVQNFSWTPICDDDWPLLYPYNDFKSGFQVTIRHLNNK